MILKKILKNQHNKSLFNSTWKLRSFHVKYSFRCCFSIGLADTLSQQSIVSVAFLTLIAKIIIRRQVYMITDMQPLLLLSKWVSSLGFWTGKFLFPTLSYRDCRTTFESGKQFPKPIKSFKDTARIESQLIFTLIWHFLNISTTLQAFPTWSLILFGISQHVSAWTGIFI
jgi:hypothetical protein